MLTEYEVKRKVEDISSSDAKPMRKVRMLLGMARALKARVRALLHARALSAQARDCNVASHLDRMLRSLRMLYEEVRLAARRVISIPMQEKVAV